MKRYKSQPRIFFTYGKVLFSSPKGDKETILYVASGFHLIPLQAKEKTLFFYKILDRLHLFFFFWLKEDCIKTTSCP